VHVDHVDPKRTAEFESARHELLGAFASKHVSEGTTFVLETDEPAYLSLRPFDRYADLDAAGARQKAVDDAVGEETLARLDATTHATLVPPHKNEIWSLEKSLTYVPPGGAALDTGAFGRIVFDEVMPEKDDAYDHAVTAEVRALGEARSPVSRIVYVSAYGSGRYVTLWLALRAADLDAPLPEEARAQEKTARGLAGESLTHGVRVRQDLGSK
jgi:hypothetical protein